MSFRQRFGDAENRDFSPGFRFHLHANALRRTDRFIQATLAYRTSRPITRRAIKFRKATARPHSSAKASAEPVSSSAIASGACGALQGANSLKAAATRLDHDPIQSDHGLDFPLEHDLFRKPASTFRDHALAPRRRAPRGRNSRGSWLGVIALCLGPQTYRHRLTKRKTWMAGTSPAMTECEWPKQASSVAVFRPPSLASASPARGRTRGRWP